MLRSEGTAPGQKWSLGCWEGAETLSGAEATNGVFLPFVLCRAYGGKPAARGLKTWESLNSLAKGSLWVLETENGGSAQRVLISHFLSLVSPMWLSVYLCTLTYHIEDQFLLTWKVRYLWSFRF